MRAPRLHLVRVVRLFLIVLAGLGVVLGTGPREAFAAPPGPVSVEDGLVGGDFDAEDLLARSGAGRSTLPKAPGGDTWVSLVGYTKPSPITTDREVGGMVIVGLPLDRLFGARGRSPALRDVQLPALEYASARHVAPIAAPAAVTGAMPIDEGAPIALSPRLARNAVAAAWRAAGLGADDSRLDAILSRARWSAMLPETRLRAVRFDDERLYTDSSADASKLRDTAGANVGLEARLTWRLDRLVYADDEPAFERMRLERHDARSRIAGRVLDALFHWQRAWLELRWAQAAARDAREPGKTRDEAEATLRTMEAEATLDVITAGWFSSWRAQRVTLVVERPASPPESL